MMADIAYPSERALGQYGTADVDEFLRRRGIPSRIRRLSRKPIDR